MTAEQKYALLGTVKKILRILVQFLMILHVSVIFGLSYLVLPAFGNDSEASVSLGQIVLQKSKAIKMVSEDLFVSGEEVRVSYVFENVTDKEVNTLVAFPVPPFPVSAGSDDSDLIYTFDSSDSNPFDFHVQVDGRPIDVSMTSRDSKEQSGAYRQLNYVWKQKFPPHLEVSVKHEYNPHPATQIASSNHDKNLLKKYCMHKGSFTGDRGAEELGYILKTGANWRGPIGKFHLVVETSDDYPRLFTCFKGLRKEGEKRFVFESRNYKPMTDIFLLMLNGS